MSNGRSFTTTFKTKAETDGISKMQEELKNLKTSLRDNKKEQKELSKEIRDAKAEITAINKEIKQTGTATEEQQAKLKKLQAVVENDTKALESLKLQQAQLQSQMGETTKKIDAQKKAMNEFKSSMADAKKYGTELVTEIGAIGAAATAAVAGLFAFTKEAAQWADDMNTLSKVTGIGTDELQKFAYASDLIDVSMDTLTGSLTKLTRTMQSASQGGTSAAAQAFQELGVSVTDSTGQLRDRQQVFYETIDALGRIANETERDALAMNIFGRSAQELNPLIKGGAETLKQLGDEAERAGLILSQATLDNLNEFNNKVDLLKAKGEQIKNLAASEMTPALDGLVEVADDLLDEINQMAKSGELKKMAKEAGEMIKTAAEALKNLISWVWKYKEGIGAVVAGLIAFKIAMSITSLVNSLVIGIKALKIATDSETASVTALNVALESNPIGLIIGLVSALAAALVTLAMTTQQSTQYIEDFNAALESIEQTRLASVHEAESEKAYIDSLMERYERLKKATSLTANEKAELKVITDQLAKSLGITSEELEKQAKDFDKLKDSVEAYCKQLVAKAKLEAATEAYKKAYQEYLDLKADYEARYWEAYKEAEANGEISNGHINDRRFHREMGEFHEAHQKAEAKIKFYNDEISQCTTELAAMGYESEKTSGATSNLGTSVETTTQAIQKMTDEFLGNISTSLQTFEKLEKEIKGSGKISLSTLNELSKKYPELNDLVDGYVKGLKTETDVLEGMRAVYEKDRKAYADYSAEKELRTGDFQRILINLGDEFVNKYNEQYGIDLRNFASFTQAKTEILEKYKKVYKAMFDEEDYNVSHYQDHYLLTKGGKLIATSYNNKDWKLEEGASQNDLNHFMSTRSKFFNALEEISELKKALSEYYNKSFEFSSSSSSSSTSSKSAASSAQAAEKTVNELFEKQKLALAAYKRLVENQIDLEKKKADAAKKSADEQIAALDKLSKKRKQDQEDEKRQKELDAVNTRLTYDRLTQFERRELLRKKQDILNEQADAKFDRDIEARKAAISAGSQSAQDRSQAVIDRLKASETQLSDRIAYLQGTQSYDQRVQNNSRTVNVQIVQNGLSADQTARRIVDKVIKELG